MAQIERYMAECETRQAQRVAELGIPPVPPARVLHLEDSPHVGHRSGAAQARQSMPRSCLTPYLLLFWKEHTIFYHVLDQK